jgi:hypothetical protein
MPLFYLTASSIGYWTQLVLVLVVAGYFASLVWRSWRRGERPTQMLLMVCFALSVVCLIVLLFLEVSVHPDWRWHAVFLQNVAVGLSLLFLLQFAYRFPFPDPKKRIESFVVLALSLFYLSWEAYLAGRTAVPTIGSGSALFQTRGSGLSDTGQRFVDTRRSFAASCAPIICRSGTALVAPTAASSGRIRSFCESDRAGVSGPCVSHPGGNGHPLRI